MQEFWTNNSLSIYFLDTITNMEETLNMDHAIMQNTSDIAMSIATANSDTLLF